MSKGRSDDEKQGDAMVNGSDRSSGHQAIPVSADDVVRVVSRALSERPWRLRLTSGQRLAILRTRPGAARA
jgi:hypothetical protein